MKNVDQKQLLLRWGAIGFAGLLILAVIGLLASYGSIRIEGISEKVQLINSDTGSIIERNSGFSFVRSGSYTLRKADDQGQYMKEVKVPRFLFSTTVTVPSFVQKKVRRIGLATLPDVLPGTNSIVSINRQQKQNTILIHPLDDPTGLRSSTVNIPLSSPSITISNGRLLGFTSTLESSSDLSPSIFDFRVNESSPVAVADTQYSESQNPKIIVPSTHDTSVFAVLYSKDEQFHIDIFRDNKKFKTMTNLHDISQTTEGSLLLGLTDTHLVIGRGADFLQGDTSTEQTTPDLDSKSLTLHVYEIDSLTEVAEVAANNLNAVSNIQLSKDGRFISLLGDQTISIYDTQSKALHYSFNSLFATDLTWLDSNRFIFKSTDNGIFSMNVDDKSSQTLFSPKNLLFSSYSLIDKDTLLFTAYHSSNGYATLPDAYTVDLSRDAEGGNELVYELPARTELFTMTSLNNTIYVSSNNQEDTGPARDSEGNFELPGFKVINNPPQELIRAAESYLTNFKGKESYQVVYGRGL